MKISDELIKRIKARMAELDINQRELSKRSGINEVTISRWLKGQRNPKIDMLDKLAVGLGTTVDGLLKSELADIRLGDRVGVLGTVEQISKKMIGEEEVEVIHVRIDGQTLLVSPSQILTTKKGIDKMR